MSRVNSFPEPYWHYVSDQLGSLEARENTIAVHEVISRTQRLNVISYFLQTSHLNVNSSASLIRIISCLSRKNPSQKAKSHHIVESAHSRCKQLTLLLNFFLYMNTFTKVRNMHCLEAATIRDIQPFSFKSHNQQMLQPVVKITSNQNF